MCPRKLLEATPSIVLGVVTGVQFLVDRMCGSSLTTDWLVTDVCDDS